MPVTGLPAASEAALTTLIESQRLLSWKMVGEGRTTVVVLRFKPEDGQPFVNTNSEYWRRKPPSQCRRDQQRCFAFQQRCKHPFPHSHPCANDHIDSQSISNATATKSKSADENGPNVSEALHEARPTPAMIDARSSRPPSVSSVCAAAVSKGENCANPAIVLTETTEAIDEEKFETEKEEDEGSEVVTPEVLHASLDKFRRDLDHDQHRSLEAMHEAIRSCVDSFPSARPPPSSSVTEEQSSSTSSLAEVTDRNRPTPDQRPPRTDRMCAVARRKADSGISPIRRALRSNRR